MIRICLVGFGYMGITHFERYLKLIADGEPVRLAAVYDVNRARFDQVLSDHPEAPADIRFYDDFDAMMMSEKPDAVDIVLPDHLHCEFSVRAMQMGAHVLCEKPMALDNAQTARMLEAAAAGNRQLMIAHCCRFENSFRTLKQIVESNRLGRPRLVAFDRLNPLPGWSEKNWLLNQKTSGGCILDMHIHDIDVLQWIFGIPEAVCALGVNAIPGSGIDGIAALYRYPDFAATIQANWAVLGDGVRFTSGFHAEFEHGSVCSRDDVTTVYQEGQPPRVIRNDADRDGYYGEIRYFIRCLNDILPVADCSAQDAASAVRMAHLESESVHSGGAWQIV